MSAREEILSAVRRAVGPADRVEVTVPRGYRTAAPGDVDVLGLFAARVEDYRATVVRCAPAQVEPALAAALAGASRVVVPAGFSWPVSEGLPDRGESAAELDRLDAVVTEATVGIATTGTLVLTHGAGQGRRALSLVPDLHVCVIRADQVVLGVPDAVALLDPSSPQTWISGPSATSDIELSRVEGVHGPRSLHVILVG